jgi:hypothetical protein
MRALVVLSIMGISLFCTDIRSQNILDRKVTVSFENLSLKEALTLLKDKSQVEFAYNDDALPNKKITLEFKQIKIKHILYYLLEDTDLNYKFFGDQIILFKYNEPSPKKVTISGYVIDSTSGEKIIGANVYLAGTNIGTTSNLYGFYSLTYYPGDWVLNTSYLGFLQFEKKFRAEQNRNIDIFLNKAIDLQEVIVVADYYTRRQVGINTARENFTSTDFEMIPAVGGEQDIIKLTQSLPGVLSGTDGLGGLHVRGGDPGQNLVLLDGVQVYNPFHTAGFFSIYNPSAIKSVTLYKSGFPARFNGLTSSVLDVRTKEGNNQKTKAEGGVSLLALNGSLEGPIKKGKSSFILTARRTHIDPWIKAATKYLNQRENKTGFTNYSFYDLNAKSNFTLGNNDKLFLSFYHGRDYFRDFSGKNDYIQNKTITYNRENVLDWGNDIGTIRWNKLISNKLFANTTFNYSNFRYNSFSFEESLVSEQGNDSNRDFNVSLYKSNIKDYSIKTDFDFIPTPVQKLKAGFGLVYHTFNPVVLTLDENSKDANLFGLNNSFANIDTLVKGESISAFEVTNYVEDEIIVNDNIIFNLGINTSFFSVQNINYLTFQPRVSLNFILNDNFSMFLSHDNLAQNLHLLSNGGFSLPNDLWIPSTASIGPLKVVQTTMGFHYRMGRGFELKAEAYFKQMKSQIAFQEGSSFSSGGVFLNGGFLDARNWEDKVARGEGIAKGFEVTFKKSEGKLKGWLSYSLANSERQFDKINYNKVFPYRYDRRHTINFVGVYLLKKGVELLANFTYGTGQPFSFASSKYFIQLPGSNQQVEVLNWTPTNSNRLEPFHRLDVGANFKNKKKWGEELIYIGLINVYDRSNTLFVRLKENPQDPFDKSFVKSSLLPILPSFSYKVLF